jgi:hypothetical protein
MSDEQTTAVVERYLDALAGAQTPEPIIRALLDRSVRGLQKEHPIASLSPARACWRGSPRPTVVTLSRLRSRCLSPRKPDSAGSASGVAAPRSYRCELPAVVSAASELCERIWQQSHA